MGTGSGTSLAKPPTGDEIGAVAQIGITPWTSFASDYDLENVPELMFPQSVLTYRAMRNDAQIDGLYTGCTLPVRRYKWMIDKNGADEAKVELLCSDLNLPMRGKDPKPVGRTKDRFVHDHHLQDALLTIMYGFYWFEQVGAIEDDGLWHLRKLAPRPPFTIQDVMLSETGGVIAVRQNVSSPKSGMIGKTAEIPIDRLVGYVWDKEGANWYGRSMLRSIYRNWLIKDRLLRVDAVKHERNGMGVPVAVGAPGMTPDELRSLSRMAASYKAGESSGGAIPHGTDLNLKGVQGSIPDTIASINYHNEEMSRRFLMMFLQLGSTLHGSRALGTEFVDYFALAQESIANWYKDLFNEHVIEDWWDWNFGQGDDLVPKLVYERDDRDKFAVADLAQMVQNNVIQVDDELEEAVRRAMDLPDKDTATVRLPAPKTPEPGGISNLPTPGDGVDPTIKAREAARRADRAAGATSPAIPLPDRPLRRSPTDFEVRAQVNFRALDQYWENTIETLFNGWKANVTELQIDEMRAKIAETSDTAKLAALQASPIGADILEEALKDAWVTGVDQAIQEAKAQGRDIDFTSVDIAASMPALRARAVAVDVLAARFIGEMAGTRAIRMMGTGVSQESVADGVKDYLTGLSHSMLRDRLAGSLTQGINEGRKAVFRLSEPDRIYASELLDANTCGPCTDIDGTEYGTLGDAEQDYPTGGFAECAGGDRCRGTLVGTYGEENV